MSSTISAREAHSALSAAFAARAMATCHDTVVFASSGWRRSSSRACLASGEASRATARISAWGIPLEIQARARLRQEGVPELQHLAAAVHLESAVEEVLHREERLVPSDAPRGCDVEHAVA